MQELIRRLVTMCETYHIRLRITHTPGVLLDQPDAISRQAGVEEPRTRLSSAAFSVVERTRGTLSLLSWGPRGNWLQCRQRRQGTSRSGCTPLTRQWRRR